VGVILAAPVSATDLFLDVQRGHLPEVTAHLETSPESVQATDDRGYTPLHWAAIRGHEDLALALLAAGAPADVTGADGGSPLHWACHHEQTDLVRGLLRAGADPNRANQWARTALHVAARRNCQRVAEVLIESGATLDATTREGWTPLHVAARAGHPEMMELLVEHGADAGALDAEGATAAESLLIRPETLELERKALDQYTGDYQLAPGFTMHVWRVGDDLRLMELAPDTIDAIGPDLFLCRQEPWRVRFERDATGVVVGIEVEFLRRTVRGARITPEHRYVGAARCRSCHTGAEHGHQDVKWLRSRHALAYWRLATDWAQALATLRPHLREITDPQSAARCRSCHVTGEHEPSARFADSFRPEAGVGCESCHGPGEAYATAEHMSSRAKLLAHGGEVPSELTCRRCHRDARFSYAEARHLIAHPTPAGAPPAGTQQTSPHAAETEG
jgi:hypothetical protein